MLARRHDYSHPTAGLFELPLLVPSFSSKGFGRHEWDDEAHEFSAIAYELEEFGRFSTRSVLVSGYDIHFQHFEAPEMQPPSLLAHLNRTGLIFLDSGGYELAEDFDSCELRRSPHEPKKGYGLEQYQAVLESITTADSTLPLVIANFDWATRHKLLEDQLRAARELLGDFSQYATTFIIKPGDGRTVVEPSSLSDDDYSNLKGFDIIGVTEKELGKDLGHKLRRLIRLRHKLDEARIEAPIHLWGGLDPVMTPLFFFAGADIFDGISWLRYAFHDGVALNRECATILDTRLGISTGADKARFMTSLHNLEVMQNLAEALQSWAAGGGDDFEMFHPHIRDSLKAAYAKIKIWDSSVKGGK